MVERDVLFAPLEPNFEVELTEQQRDLLTITESEDGKQWLRGTVPLWVEGYASVIGVNETSPRHMNKLSRTLAEVDEADLRADPMWSLFSTKFVLDYLVANSDRNSEVGSVVLPDATSHLVMLRHADRVRRHALYQSLTSR
jgi:hypothetical protein